MYSDAFFFEQSKTPDFFISNSNNNATVNARTTSSQNGNLQIIEGPLSKWTNVMQGWQCRWFVLDQSSGLLSYYTSRQKMRLGVRRGCIRLINGKACIGLDDEDKNVFTITDLAVDKTFHFMTKDHEERSFWLKHLEETIKYTKINTGLINDNKNNQSHHVVHSNNLNNNNFSLQGAASNNIVSSSCFPSQTQNIDSFNQNQREISSLTKVIKNQQFSITTGHPTTTTTHLLDNSCASSTSSRNSKISAVLSAAEQSLSSLDYAMQSLSANRQTENNNHIAYDVSAKGEKSTKGKV